MVDLRIAPFHLDDEAVAWVEATLASLSEEERVGQLFTLMSTTGDEATMASLVERARPGGVMFRPGPATEIAAGIAALQRASRVPVLVAANLERGGDGLFTEGTNVGTPMQVAATREPALAHALGLVAGREAASVGGNWAFAPTVDIDLNFRNPITNTRTFGSDPALVRDLSTATVRGFVESGVAPCPKHFPGDGVDERDQHLAISSNDLPADQWDATYGEVFRAVIAAGAPSVMVGHITMPAWSRRLQPGIRDEDLLPASLAPELVGGLLRGHLGFNGLVITDATTMAGMEIAMPRERLVPAAIAAGCDMVLFARNVGQDLDAMRRGIRDGVITLERLDEALRRILGLKAWLGLHRQAVERPLAVPIADGGDQRSAWADRVAEASVTLVKDTARILPLDPVRHRRVLLHDIHGGEGFFDTSDRGADRLFVELLEREGFQVTRYVPPSSWEMMEFPPTTDTTDRFDLVLYLARLATRSNQTVVRIEWAQPMGANAPVHTASMPTVFVSLENPYHLLDVPRVSTFVNAYSPSPRTVRAVVDKLLGRSEFRGASPVDPFCGRWDARL